MVNAISLLHAEELEDVHVFAGLGHDPLVGRDDEEDEVDPAGPGEHVADELLVARDVDHPTLPAGGKFDRGEAKLDRDPALLLFLEAVGVDPRQHLDEEGLAVVDVSGGAEDRGA
ncbi:MAG: hypothetical protein IPK72_19605 [Candidatus Eisenbacteria bacterium]|nr:hypothetical protein [Candidatus Eisenbacteria bacterium]